MSDGRRFALDFDKLSPEELLPVMQKKYFIIQERIQTYDALIQEHNNLKNALQEIDEKLKSVPFIIKKEMEEFYEFKKMHKATISRLDIKTDSIQDLLNSQHTDQEKIKQNTESQFSTMENRVCNLEHKFTEEKDKNESNSAHLNSLDQQTQVYFNELQASAQKINKINEKCEFLQNSFNKIVQVVNDYRTEIEMKVSPLFSIIDSFDQFKKDINTDLLKKQFNIQSKINDYFEEAQRRSESSDGNIKIFKDECEKIIKDNFLELNTNINAI